jgi:serine-type D-Ala-D-Ala carboxypeptidase (penicillin-binding protein 5/6)
MRNLLLLLSVCLFAVPTYANTASTDGEGKSLPIAAYLVKEVGSSELLMAKNKDRRVSPASLTKILTSIIAIESGRLDEEVTITKVAAEAEPSKAGFSVGDRIRLRDLVKAAMVSSSNDAAFAIAVHLGGSLEGFARLMNAKAARIGMTSSNFTNPAGFDRGSFAGNYSTAEDLLRLAEYAIRNPTFNQIARLSEITVVELGSGKEFQLNTHNKLLDRYPYAVGIKTGFTNKAGRCLIARAQKDDKDVLLVMMQAHVDRWNAAEDLFEKAFVMEAPEPEIVEQIPATAAKKAVVAKKAEPKKKDIAAASKKGSGKKGKKAAAAAQPKAKGRSKAKAKAKTESKPKSVAKADPKSAPKGAAKPDKKPAAKSSAKADQKPAEKPAPRVEYKPSGNSIATGPA